MRQLLILLCCLLFAASCDNMPENDSATARQAAAPNGASAAAAGQPVETPTAESPAAAAEGALAGTQLALADGREVEVLSVGKFDQAQASVSGLVAIEGRVAEAFPDQGALVLVDVDNMAGCGDSCCPQAQVPVKVNLADYSGALPVAGQQVVVVGDIARTGLGFELTVAEIRCGGETVLERAAAQA